MLSWKKPKSPFMCWWVELGVVDCSVTLECAQMPLTLGHAMGSVLTAGWGT